MKSNSASNSITNTTYLEKPEKVFFTYPVDTKPPIVGRLSYAQKSIKVDANGTPTFGPRSLETIDYDKFLGYDLYLALAGFSRGHVKVFRDGPLLIISGDNTVDMTTPERFRMKFERVFAVRSEFDLEEVFINMSHGLLHISIPLKKEKSSQKRIQIKDLSKERPFS